MADDDGTVRVQVMIRPGVWLAAERIARGEFLSDNEDQ
jgi:hypothetical protein